MQHTIWRNQEVISYLLFATGAIAGIILLLVVILLIWRVYQLIETKRKRKKREDYSDLILSNLRSEKFDEKIQDYVKKNPVDVPVFFQICMELIQSLRGSSQENIEQLLAIEEVQLYYMHKLKTADKKGLADALTFFSFFTNWDAKIEHLIRPFLTHENVEISYVAALALLKSARFDLQKEAFRTICRREDVSKVTILELIIVFSEFMEPDYNKGDLIGEMIIDADLPLKNRYVLIQAIGELELIHLAPKLYLLLQSTISKDKEIDSTFVGGIIQTLGKLYWIEVLSEIRQLLPSADSTLKIFCAKALGELRGPESILLLEKLLEDPERRVKIEAMNQLIRRGKPVLSHLPKIDGPKNISIREHTLKEIEEAGQLYSWTIN